MVAANGDRAGRVAIVARTDQPNEAIPMIQRLLTTFGPVDNYEASMALADLRMR